MVVTEIQLLPAQPRTLKWLGRNAKIVANSINEEKVDHEKTHSTHFYGYRLGVCVQRRIR
jgi:hypothetical protein